MFKFLRSLFDVCVYTETFREINEFGVSYSSVNTKCGSFKDKIILEYVGEFCENCGKRIVILKTKNIKIYKFCTWQNSSQYQPNFLYSVCGVRLGKVITEESLNELKKINNCYRCGKKVKLEIINWKKFFEDTEKVD